MSFYASAEQFQYLDRQINSAEFHGSQCKQDLDGQDYTCTNGSSYDNDISQEYDTNEQPARETISADQISQALNGKFQVQLYVDASTKLSAGNRNTDTELKQLPGSFVLPGNPDLKQNDVLLSEQSAQRLNVAVVDTITASDFNSSSVGYKTINPATANLGDLTLTVKAIIPTWANYVIAPTLFTDTNVPNISNATWVFGGKDDISWDDVKALNQLGLVVKAQKLQSNPNAIPLDDMYPEYRASLKKDQKAALQDDPEDAGYWFQMAFDTVSTYIVYLIAACLALATISPIFAIATSRQTKTYALMRSQGATRRHIRWAVMTYDTISGVIGAVLGIVVGLTASFIDWKVSHPGWPFTTDPMILLQGFAAAVVGATVSAFVPAVITAMGPIISGVEGARPDRILKWRNWMWTGPACVVFVVAVLFITQVTSILDFLSGTPDNPNVWGNNIPLIGTVILSIVGLVGIFGSIIILVYSAGVIQKPLAARLAGRLVRREALKSGAIIAAIIGTAFVTTAIDTDTMLDEKEK